MDRRKFFGSLFGTVATLIVLPLSFDHPKRNRCQEIADKFLAGFKERRRKASLQNNRDVSRKKLYKILDKS